MCRMMRKIESKPIFFSLFYFIYFSPNLKRNVNFKPLKGLGSPAINATATNVPYQFGVGSSSNPPPGVFAFGATPVLEV